MKANVIVVDPPWSWGDKLTMSAIKRGADSNYETLSIEQLKHIPIQDVSDDDYCVLALWVVGSQLQEGLDLMKAWGFRQTQTWVWVKTKQEPLKALCKDLLKAISTNSLTKDFIEKVLFDFSLDLILNFNMGRLFRQTHEICLLGVKGDKVYKSIKNKSQRSVCFNAPGNHSVKPEDLQDRLEIMFPGSKYLELFARRQRKGWVCVGKEAPLTLGQDILESIELVKRI